MKKHLKHFFSVIILLLIGLNSNAQLNLGENLPSNSFDFCGANVTVYCDGTVDVTLPSEGVQIFKVYEGGQEIVDLNQYENPSLEFDGSTFNTNELIPLGIWVDITGNENRWIYLDTDCGQATFNLSQAFAAACPPTISYCGAEWEVDCSGNIQVDLTEARVNIYKVYNGETLLAEFNNYDETIPDVPNIIFNTGDVIDLGFGPIQFGNDVPVIGNYYVYVDTDCGQAFINFSQILAQYCSTYNPNSPNYDPTYVPFIYEEGSVDEAAATEKSKEVIDTKADNPSLNLTANQSKALVFPNPTTDELNINLPQLEETFNIQLLNMNGQTVREITKESGSIKMNLENLTSGIYLLKVTGDTFNQVEKIQISK